MKIYIMTDLECVAGVVTFPEYCLPSPVNKYNQKEGGKYYEKARELATLEVNAAIEGLIAGGATDVFVCDGHGPGGLNSSLIHPRARVLTGKNQKHQGGLDDSFDAAIMIGQHAMANVDGGHLCHSGSFDRDEWLLNEQPIGEIGLFMLKASYFNVPVIMISGDKAGCAEAQHLAPSIETAVIIEGQKLGSTKGMTVQEAIDFNVAAVHLSPVKSRQLIREAAKRSLKKTMTAERFWVAPPYEMVRIRRPRNNTPSQHAVNRAEDLIELINQPSVYQ